MADLIFELAVLDATKNLFRTKSRIDLDADSFYQFRN